MAGACARRFGAGLLEVMSVPLEARDGFFRSLFHASEQRRSIPSNLDSDLELVFGGPLDKPEELAYVVSIRDKVEASDVKVRIIHGESAEEGLEGKGGISRGVLINENSP